VRVLFVTNLWPDAQRPWYGTFVHTQARSLEALGVEVSVQAIRGYASRFAYARAIGDVARGNGTPPYDVVHAHYGHSAVVARFQRRAPLVVSYCGDDLLGTRRPDGGVKARSRMEATVFRQVARVAAATITKSEEMERALPAAVRHRNHVIPNGVDLARFRRLDRAEARRELGWAEDETVALFAANPDVVSKNHPLAAQAARRAAARVPRLRLRVAWGAPPERMPLMMSAADALLMTSTSEGSPNVVKEAMACELPVVSTPVGDAPERLSGVAGCHVRPADADALADALVDAVGHGRSPEARTAVEPLSLERVAERVLAVYREVAARR
jgi:glycosyltransferase involved in cell wall biosynthesis